MSRPLGYLLGPAPMIFNSAKDLVIPPVGRARGIGGILLQIGDGRNKWLAIASLNSLHGKKVSGEGVAKSQAQEYLSN